MWFVLLYLVYVCFVDRCLSFCPLSFDHSVLPVLRFTDSEYHFGIFKLFLMCSLQFWLVFLESSDHGYDISTQSRQHKHSYPSTS